MAYLTASVEYGLHCLLLLAGSGDRPVSGRDLAEFQGLSPTFVAKIFQKLEKAKIVAATEGVRGGYKLALASADLSVLAVIDAIEGSKPFFECQEIRGRCALFSGDPPSWATRGVCAVHGAMLQAEKAMRDVLAGKTLADLGAGFERAAAASFGPDMRAWFEQRLDARGTVRPSIIASRAKAQPQ